MELNRRNFVKLLVGGVAGIQATPLPWKLTDDIAIWTQNWPWVPVPPVGAFEEASSVCTLCPGGCGISIRKVDDRAVKIEGREDFPVNPGGICPTGMGGLQLLYDRDLRFAGPMKRVGPRGSGQYMEIDWEEALDTLAQRIAGLREQGRPQALAAVDGNRPGTTLALLIERLLHTAGSRNYLRLPSLEDTYAMTLELMQGSAGPMAYDLENADYILSVGSGLLEGWGAPGRVLNAWGLWHPSAGKSTAQIVQVESRASNTASKADRWVPVRPGTETALILSMAHVLISEKRYDQPFVDGHTEGFGAFKKLVAARFAPAEAAKAVGLPADTIVTLAHEFAQAKAPLAIYGKGRGDLNGSLHESMAVHALNALAGRFNRPGGLLPTAAPPLSPLPAFKPDAVASKGLAAGRLDQAGTPPYPHTASRPEAFARAVLAADKGAAVDTLLVLGANPAYTLPDGGLFARALARIPFIVSFSPFRDETAVEADLILPDHMYLEKQDELVSPPGLQYPLYALTRPVVTPVTRTRHCGDVLLQLAERLGAGVSPAFPWDGYQEVLKARAQGLFGSGGGPARFAAGDDPIWQASGAAKEADNETFEDLWARLTAGGLWYRPPQRGQETAAKVAFRAERLEAALTAAAAEAAGAKVSGTEATLIMVPYDLINLNSAWAPPPPYLSKTLHDDQLRKDEAFLEINPETAARHGVTEGDRVVVRSSSGEARLRVHLFDGAMPGVIYLLAGLGRTAYDEFWQGKGVNPNELIHSEPDPLSGHPVWWRTPVTLEKA